MAIEAAVHTLVQNHCLAFCTRGTIQRISLKLNWLWMYEYLRFGREDFPGVRDNVHCALACFSFTFKSPTEVEGGNWRFSHIPSSSSSKIVPVPPSSSSSLPSFPSRFSLTNETGGVSLEEGEGGGRGKVFWKRWFSPSLLLLPPFSTWADEEEEDGGAAAPLRSAPQKPHALPLPPFLPRCKDGGSFWAPVPGGHCKARMRCPPRSPLTAM